MFKRKKSLNFNLFCLQDGRRFAKKAEVFILSTENKESIMNDDVIRNTEVDTC